MTPKEKWGSDHWGLLVYCESRSVDHGGKLDFRHMRPRHPDKHPTRLKDGETLANHGDVDILVDLEEAGYIKNLGTGATPLVQMTEEGWRIGGLLRRFRGQGGKKWTDFKE